MEDSHHVRAVHHNCPVLSEELTKREQEIADLYAGGRSSIEIMAALDITRRTLATHRARIMQKKSAEGLAHLVGMLSRDKIQKLERRVAELEQQVEMLRRTVAKEDA